MKSVLKIQILVFIATIIGGCASVDYIGQRYEPTSKVTFITGGIPSQYKMIGKAQLTSPDNYTGYEIKQKLIQKAKSVGADAILIVSSERKETGSYSVSSGNKPGFQTTSSLGAGNWNPDGTELSTNSFGQTGNSDKQIVKSWETIIKAYFLRLRSKPSGKDLIKKQNSDIERKELTTQDKSGK